MASNQTWCYRCAGDFFGNIDLIIKIYVIE